MGEFRYAPAKCIPFRDLEAIERVRKIRRKDITKHWNPEFKISVLPAAEIEFRWLMDMFYRIKTAADAGTTCVLITPQPWPNYSRLAWLINMFRVNCADLYTFNMDEYANEDGVTPPEDWPQGFMHCMKKYFYAKIDRKLRPPENHIQGPTDGNIKDYGRMIADMGGADCCYSGPGWTGHLAFIEPDAPEFDAPLKEWKKMGPRICTLSPFTIAQNSLHGAFGMSGDLAAVPPKAATIGPAEVIAAKNRIDMHAITVDGSFASWQRLVTRLVLHGPVTPRVPESILQTLRTTVYVSEQLAADIEPHWDKGY
jgi:6-phosphogluconolactonase/glucosamine-6-phosphate isomerase/deaminase